MRHGSRALVELTAWLTQHVEEFFATVPAGHEFEARLEEIGLGELDAAFTLSDALHYRLRFFPDFLTTEPRGLLPPGYDPAPTKEPQIKFTFAIWSHREPPRDEPAGEISRLMRRDVMADLHSHRSQGVARGRFARLGTMIERRLPGHSLQYVATVPSAGDLVSVFVDLDSLQLVAGLID